MLEWTDWHEKHSSKILMIPGIDCWIWTAGHVKNYGRVSYNRKAEYAHRAAFIESGGTFEDGPMVRHLCGNAGCVRPGHLKAGTSADNGKDTAQMFSAGRSKLNEADVFGIRSEYNNGMPLGDIAAKYGIAYGSVYPIVIGRAYKFVGQDVLPQKAQRNPRKLTADDVASIKAMLADGNKTQTAIALMFGVRANHISRISSGIRHR